MSPAGESHTSPLTTDIISPVAGSYRTDPAYQALMEEESLVQGEIVSLNRKITDVQSQVKSAVNPVQQARFQKKVTEFTSLLNDKQTKLNQIQSDIAARENLG